MEIFIILTVCFYFPFLMYYFAFRFKKNGTVNPLRNRGHIVVILFNLLLFITSLVLICFSTENEEAMSDIWITIPLLSLGISILPFIFYLKELSNLKWKRFDNTAAKIQVWINNESSPFDYDKIVKVIIEGTETSYKCYKNKKKLEQGDEKLKFVHEGFERKGSPKLIGLVAFHVMHFNTLEKYDATKKGIKAIVIKEMFNYLNTYFDLEVFKDNKTLKDSDNKSKYFSKENCEVINKYIDQYEKLK